MLYAAFSRIHPVVDFTYLSDGRMARIDYAPDGFPDKFHVSDFGSATLHQFEILTGIQVKRRLCLPGIERR